MLSRPPPLGLPVVEGHPPLLLLMGTPGSHHCSNVFHRPSLPAFQAGCILCSKNSYFTFSCRAYRLLKCGLFKDNLHKMSCLSASGQDQKDDDNSERLYKRLCPSYIAISYTARKDFALVGIRRFPFSDGSPYCFRFCIL